MKKNTAPARRPARRAPKSRRKSAVTKSLFRRFHGEQLEDRMLLAGVSSAWHNYALPTDVNNDGSVTAVDAFVLISALRNGGSRSLSAPAPAATSSTSSGEGEGPATTPTAFVDVNGDNVLSPIDAFMVINRLRAEGQMPTVDISLRPVSVGQLTGINEVQTINLPVGVTGGTFTITLNSQTTAAIPFSSTPATLATSVQNALAALPSVGVGNVTALSGRNATGQTAKGAKIQVTFRNALSGTDVAPMTLNTASLTPVTGGTVEETVKGGPTLTGTLTVGQTFGIEALVQDIRNQGFDAVGDDNRAVAQAYFDMVYNNSVFSTIAATPPPTNFQAAFNPTYLDERTGTDTGNNSGQLDEYGASLDLNLVFTFFPGGIQLPLNTATFRVDRPPINAGNDIGINVPEDSVSFTIDVLANDTTGGMATFSTNVPEDSSNQTVVLNPGTPVDPNDIIFGQTSVNIAGGTKAIQAGSITGLPVGHTASIDTRGTPTTTDDRIVYTPPVNFNGPVSFQYTFSDGFSTRVATVSLTVTPVNDAPVLTAANPTATTDEDTPITLALSSFINNGAGTTMITDVDGPPIGGIAIIGAVGNGTFAFAPTGAGGPFTNVTTPPSPTSALLLPNTAAIRYTPDGKNGETATITYRAWDQSTGMVGLGRDASVFGNTTAFSTNTDTATLNVTAVNDAPMPVADSRANSAQFVVNNVNPVTPSRSVLANDVEVDNGQTLSVNFVRSTSGGTTTAVPGMITTQQGAIVTMQSNGTFTYNPNGQFGSVTVGNPGSDSFFYDVTDGIVTVPNVLVELDVVANQPPVARTDNFNTTEDATVAGNVLVNNGNGADSDPENDPIRVTRFDATSTNGATISGITATGMTNGNFTYDPRNAAALQALRAGQTLNDRFTYTLADTLGNTTEGTVSVTVTGVNDAPTIAGAVAGQNVNDNATIQPFTGVTIADVDTNPSAQTQTVIVTLDVAANGTFTMASLGGFTQGPAGTFTFNGTAPNATTAIRGLVFQPTANQVPVGSTVTTRFTISANDGAAPAVTNNSTTVIATSINDAPVLTPSGVRTLTGTNEDTTSPATTVANIIGSTITDVDNAAVRGIAIINTSGAGTWEFATNGSFNSVGMVSGTQALLLRPTDSLRYVPDAKNGESATITYRAWDQTSGTFGTKVNITSTGGTSAFSTSTDVATLTVTSVNDAPVLTPSGARTLTAINEDPMANPGNTVSSIVGGTITDVDNPNLQGIAVFGVDNTLGNWQFSTNNGTSFTNFGSPSASAARLLRSQDMIRFVPNAEFFGTATFQYRAWDQTSGAFGNTLAASPTGGTSAFSTGTDTATITINSVNDPPFAGNDNFLVLKNNPQNLVVLTNDRPGPAGVPAPFNESGQTITIKTVSMPMVQTYRAGTSAPGMLVQQPNGSFNYTPAPDFEGVVTFTYTIEDNGSPALESNVATVTIDVVDFIPSTFSGFVYLDGNNDGNKGAGEKGIGGVELRLQGMDVFNRMIDVTTHTKRDGSYLFDKDQSGNPLAPSNNYTLTQMQPAFVNDGIDRTATPGVAMPLDTVFGQFSMQQSANDTFQARIGRLGDAHINANFGELGLAPQYISTFDLLASTPKTGALIAVKAGQTLWYDFQSGWDGFRSVSLTLSPDRTMATLTAIDSGGMSHMVNISAQNNPRLVFQGQQGTCDLVRLYGSAADFGFMAGGAGGEGEGSASSYAQAVDSVFASGW